MVRIIRTDELTSNAALSPNDTDWVYNGLDVCVTLEVRDALLPQLDEVTARTYKFSKSLQAPILDMTMRGTLISQKKRTEALTAYQAQARVIQAQLRRLVTEGIGLEVPEDVFDKRTQKWKLWWRSTEQLKRLFYSVMGCAPIRKRNAKGQMVPTINRDALERLSETYFYAEPIAKHILALRDIDKKRMFLETEVDADQRIRTNFNIAGTDTGRLSSSISDFGTGGNVQNIDKELRSCFIADPGMMFANLDLEQADARNVGAICWNLFVDELGEAVAGAYLDACESGDLHTSVCRMAWPGLQWGDDPAAFRSVADQIAYRTYSYRDLAKKLGHGCLTGDHEVLTPEGWVPISSLPSTIMQWSPGGSRFVQPSHWEAKPYTGQLQVFEGRAISAVMTHDHRVPYYKDANSSVLHEQPAEAGPGKFMPLGSGWVGGTEVVPARLIAAFMADGHQETNWMSFHFCKERKRQRLIELCERYGFEYRIHGDKIRVRGRLPKYPGAFQFQWTADCLADFVDELKHWDGTIGETAVSISSTRRKDLEWFQTFGRLVGVGGNISHPYTSGFGSTVYRLQQNNRQFAFGGAVKHTTVEASNVMVFCPTVESGWFYVRHQGRIFVTGNTNYYGTPPTMAKHSKVDKTQIELFQLRYFGGFPVIGSAIDPLTKIRDLESPNYHNWVRYQLKHLGYITTLFGRRRFFYGRYNDDSTLRKAIAYAPQSMTADEIDTGILALWRSNRVQLLIQVHDSILLQFPEHLVDTIVPWALETLKAPLTLKRDRRFVVPTEAKIGWNWGDFDPVKNPDGLMKWKGGNDRKRQEKPGKSKLSLKDFL